MFRKTLIHFLSLLLFISFAQFSSSEENDKLEENDREVENEQEEKGEEYIEDKVKDFESSEGFIQVYQDPETSSLHFKIKKSQLNKEIIYFAHVKDGVVTARKNRGSYLDNGVLKFEKHFDTIRLLRVNTNFSFDKNSALSKSAGANISDSVIKVFPITATNESDDEYLISVSSLLVSESLTPIKPIPYPEGPPPEFIWGQLSLEKSRILSFHNYPKNTDIEVEYVFENPPSYGYELEDAADPRNISISLRYSFIQMPENNFEPRLADQRVGYFTDRITNLTTKDLTPYGDLINKWNLQKKNPEEELSEPVKPITFWMENTTPVELRPYIEEGVLAWNAAFEKAGFINALEVKMQPDDADWDAGDIRYNVLRWTSSPNPPFGGYGPSFTNPRTGEIIGADIMLEWVYLTNRINIDSIFPISNKSTCYAGSKIQEGNILANIISSNFTKEPDPKIVKQSIVRLTLHEVGHTLGLNHNFKASHLNDPVSVHDPEITQKTGVTASVMEYPAVNLAPIGVNQGDYYDVVTGPYDNWAIEFGYTPNLNEKQRKEILFKSDEPELIFGNDADDMRSPGKGIDPRAMTNDLTNDPITYATQRIQLVNKTLNELPINLEAKSWEEYENAYQILFRESNRSLQTVSRFIGGVYVNRTTPDQKSNTNPYEPVDKETQKRAMSVLVDLAFSPKAFPVSQDVLKIVQKERRGFDLFGEHEDPQIHRKILSIQSAVLAHLLNGWTLDRLTDSSAYGNTYSVNEMITDLTDGIFKEDINTEVNSVRQNLQNLYVRRLIKIIEEKPPYQMTSAAVYSSLRNIEKIAKKRSQDPETQAHREFLLWLIKEALND
tara:strand:- start:291 stop:2801 length:2511 start_codon:yes stop_codon:yes gene_type:complete